MDAPEVMQANVSNFDSMAFVNFNQFLAGWHHVVKWDGAIFVEEVKDFAKAMPGKRVLCDGVDVLDVPLVLATNKINDVLVVDVWMQNHVITANHIVVSILWDYFVRLGEVVLKMKAAFMHRNRVWMITLVERHEVITAGETIPVKVIKSGDVTVELPAEPKKEAGFHCLNLLASLHAASNNSSNQAR